MPFSWGCFPGLLGLHDESLRNPHHLLRCHFPTRGPVLGPWALRPHQGPGRGPESGPHVGPASGPGRGRSAEPRCSSDRRCRTPGRPCRRRVDRLSHVARGPGGPGRTGAGERPHGWQCHATRIQTKFYRDRVLMPALSPSAQALLRAQAGPQAGMWLTAIPAEAATTLPPQAMLVALRRRLRLALPLCPSRCSPNPNCGGTVDAFGDHARMSKYRLVGQTCQSRGARLGPSGTGSRGAGRPDRATTVARPHNCPRRAATGPPTPGPLQLAVARFAATRPWCPLSQGRVTLSLAPSKSMGPPCRLQSVASRQLTPGSRAEARKHCWCWAQPPLAGTFSTLPALCAQLIANLGPPEQPGVRRCPAHGLHLFRQPRPSNHAVWPRWPRRAFARMPRTRTEAMSG